MLHDEDKAWVDVVDSWQWLPGGKELLWVSERDGWRHAYAAPRDGSALRLLTPGDVRHPRRSKAWTRRPAASTSSPRPTTRRAATSTARAWTARAPPSASPRRTQPGTHAYDISPDGALRDPHVLDRRPAAGHRPRDACRRTRASACSRTTRRSRRRSRRWLTPPIEFFQVDIGDGVTLDGWMMKPQELRPVEEVPAAHVRLRRAGRRRGHRHVARRPRPLPPRARRRRVRRRLRGQPRHAGAQGPRVAQGHLRRGRRARLEGAGGRGPRAARRRGPTSIPSAWPRGAGAAAAR